MRVRWLHTADVHLGYQQYGSGTRAEDFARAFAHVCEHALRSRVDFVLVAGDLFHKRIVDPRTMGQATDTLRSLRTAGIPVLGVEGNHERALSSYDGWTWLRFLSVEGLIHHLEPDDSSGASELRAWDEDECSGGYFDVGGVRVFGIKYYGASAPRVLERVANQLEGRSDGASRLNIIMLHEGMEGQIPRLHGGLSGAQLDVLRPHCAYLALGHIHKRYEHAGWAYNPGSLETVSTEECDWERGYYEVEADTESGAVVSVTHHTNPRREFRRVAVAVEACGTPEALTEAALGRVERAMRGAAEMRPVLDVTLRGTLQFADEELPLARLEERIRASWDPLVVRIKNATLPAGFAASQLVGEDGQIDRRALEMRVFTDLLVRDARYAPAADAWAETVQALKDTALAGEPPDEMASLLERGAASARDAAATGDDPT